MQGTFSFKTMSGTVILCAWMLHFVKLMLISNFQNDNVDESQRKLSLEIQKIREEMGKWEQTSNSFFCTAYLFVNH